MRAPVLGPALLLGALCACDVPPAVDEPIDQRAAIPPAPENGMQIVGPEIEIPAGADQMWCWVPDIAPEAVDHLVARFETFQGESGHHLLVMKSIIPRTPGEVFDCTQQENMSTVRPLITPSSANSEGTFELLTDDFAVRLPANTQLVLQSHYVNVNTRPIVVRDVGNLLFLDEGEDRIEANYFTVHNGVFEIPATNAPYTHSVDCVMEQDMTFASVIGHMHEWGKRITVEHVTAEGASTVYEVGEWGPQFRDAPPVTHYPLDAALTVAQGDTLRLTCEWLNDTDEALSFPNEMCNTVLVYYPALPEGFIICGE